MAVNKDLMVTMLSTDTQKSEFHHNHKCPKYIFELNTAENIKLLLLQKINLSLTPNKQLLVLGCKEHVNTLLSFNNHRQVK